MVDAFALVLGIVAAAGDEVGGVTVLCDVGGVAEATAVEGGGVCPSLDGPPGDGGVGPACGGPGERVGPARGGPGY